MKRIKGHAIYQPAGAAEEYSTWACNLHKGCDHQCVYCYCRFGPLAHTLGGPTAILKDTLKSPDRAYTIFCRELDKWKEKITAAGGLLFSFSTDPLMPTTFALTRRCVTYALSQGVPVQLLTKAIAWLTDTDFITLLYAHREIVRIGFTLTGHDELEPGAPSNAGRIAALVYLSGCEIYTFVSMEPIIDFASSLKMIFDSCNYVQEYRFGLQSPFRKSQYTIPQAQAFMSEVEKQQNIYGFKVIYKNSFNKLLNPASYGK